jgi:outer membrane protein OmpA-like peptidoglycan-associated protein
MLENISRGMTFDAASLEFDFTTELETVQFNFFFGSEEYTEYVNSEFNDVFAFFISGPGYGSPKNLAIVPKNKAPITVNTVNHIYNRSNYLDNNPFDRLGHLQRDKMPSLYPDLLRNYEYDGFTTLLTAEARVKPGAVYHIKITIADVSDSRYDSGVFLEASSFTSLPQDPEARAQILTNEYANAKRKFRPVTVGENPGNPGETLPEISETVAEFPSKDWRFMVNFDFDEATLSRREKARLDSLWENVLSKSSKKVYVQGHTDDVGDEAYNDRLSDSRAQAVYDHLQSRGMQVQRIVKHGFGYHKPVTSNATDQGRALNRRVEIGVEQP